MAAATAAAAAEAAAASSSPSRPHLPASGLLPQPHRAHGAAEFVAVSLLFALAARWLYVRHTRPARQCVAAYVPYSERYEDRDDVAAVACAPPRLPALSNVRGARVPGGGLRPADTSTALVLGARVASPWKRDVWAMLQKERVTTNRFDVDAFLSVWAFVNRAQALAHDGGERLRGGGAGCARRWPGGGRAAVAAGRACVAGARSQQAPGGLPPRRSQLAAAG
jgi:hypothetical protein